MKNIILLLTALLLLINVTTALDPGDSYVLKDIPKCVDKVIIKIRGETVPKPGEYDFPGCSQIDNKLWHCFCDGSSKEIKLVTRDWTKNIYDIVVEYYINAVDADNTRTLNFNTVLDACSCIKKLLPAGCIAMPLGFIPIKPRSRDPSSSAVSVL